MGYTTSYGYGYTTGMRHTTTKTTSAHIPHIIWNSNSDSRAEWQLTARPHESPKYASMTSTKQYEWPKGEDRAKDEPFCQCCPTFKWFIHIFINNHFESFALLKKNHESVDYGGNTIAWETRSNFHPDIFKNLRIFWTLFWITTTKWSSWGTTVTTRRLNYLKLINALHSYLKALVHGVFDA